jgi:IS30 family transposase
LTEDERGRFKQMVLSGMGAAQAGAVLGLSADQGRRLARRLDVAKVVAARRVGARVAVAQRRVRAGVVARPGLGDRLVWDRLLEAMSRGASWQDAVGLVGVSVREAARWVKDHGPVCLSEELSKRDGYRLTLTERQQIAKWHGEGVGVRQTARRLGRSPSTVSRELRRNRDPDMGYLPADAHQKASCGARRPKPAKLVHDGPLRRYVQDGLKARLSPEQISGRLVVDYPGDETMRVCMETIYQALYVQARGGLKREVEKALRHGRAQRRPRGGPGQRRERIKDKVMISARPADVEDRAVPGHWEGDLITGQLNRSAIGTLVERTSRFTMLVHLPEDHGALAVRDGVSGAIKSLPEAAARSLTWDQGIEMARHAQITKDTTMPVFFCDPHSPWQRGSNENTNGLLRQYFPKGTDLSAHSASKLARVAGELNSRPRKTLNYLTPAEALAYVLGSDIEAGGRPAGDIAPEHLRAARRRVAEETAQHSC